MNRPDDFEKVSASFGGLSDDEESRALEEEVDRALEGMSDQELEYWIGRLIRMLEDAGSRFH